MATKKTGRRSAKKTPTRSRKASPKRAATTASAPKRGTKLSGLDAAIRVLNEAGEPLNCSDLIQRMLDKKYWSTKGKTPANTLYAAILREINTKGRDARFRKVARGLFAANT